MKMRTFISRLALTGMMILSMGIFAGCSARSGEQALSGNETAVLADGGTLIVRVNPEIAVEYDGNGKVTAVRGKNQDGKDIVAGYQDYIGKECREVVGDLVGAIHKAGYFVEEVEGEGRKITIEIETGSSLPKDQFLDEIVTDIKQYVADMKMSSPVVVEGETDYGVTIYDSDSYETAGETPYEATNYTPYDDPATPYEATNYEESAYTPYTAPTAPAATVKPVEAPAAAAPAEATDYTPYDDPATPYEATNYTPYEEPATPYEATNYTPYEEPATPYEASDYEESGYSDY